MDSLEAGVVVLAPDGRVRLHNDAAARLLGWAEGADPALPAELAEALPANAGGEASVAVDGRVLVVQQRVVRARGRVDAGGSATTAALDAAAREGVTTAPAGSKVLVLHDRTDLQRLGDELTVAHTLTTALRSQTHEHANQLHTALALLDSDRLDAARVVLSRRAGGASATDDVVAALLDAKAAQARERGVALAWSADLTAPSPYPRWTCSRSWATSWTTPSTPRPARTRPRTAAGWTSRWPRTRAGCWCRWPTAGRARPRRTVSGSSSAAGPPSPPAPQAAAWGCG